MKLWVCRHLDRLPPEAVQWEQAGVCVGAAVLHHDRPAQHGLQILHAQPGLHLGRHEALSLWWHKQSLVRQGHSVPGEGQQLGGTRGAGEVGWQGRGGGGWQGSEVCIAQ